MKELNFREISILNVLLKKEFVEAAELMQAGNISLRTLQAEIHLINDVLADQQWDIQIANQRGKGFFLDYSIEQTERIEQLTRHCEGYLNVSLNQRFGSNQRVPYICRYFFTKPTFIKIEELATVLNVSIATITKDMHEVRRLLDRYELSIQALPYYGMKVVGSELAIRSCMLDLLNIYSFSLESVFFEAGLEQYGFTKAELIHTMNHVREVIHQADYPLTDSGFQVVVKYLLLVPLRAFASIEIEEAAGAQLAKLQEFDLAQKLLGTKPSRKELSALTLFLLINSELEFISDSTTLTKIVPEVPVLYDKIIAKFKKQYGLSLGNYQDVKPLLSAFLIKYQLRKKLQIKEFEVWQKDKKIVRKFPSSVSLACHIYHELPNNTNVDFDDRLFYEFALSLYSLVYRLKNKYEETTILVVNSSGKITKDVLISKLRLSDFNVKFEFAYVYELAALDFTKYDYALVSKELNYDSAQLPIPTLMFDFFLSSGFASVLWQQIFIAKRKIGPVTNYLVQPKVIELDGELEQNIDAIATYLCQLPQYKTQESKKEFKRLISALINNADYSSKSMIKYINLFSTNDMPNRYFIFRFKKTVQIKNRAVNSLQIIFLDGSKGLLEIKNGDSELRRYFQH